MKSEAITTQLSKSLHHHLERIKNEGRYRYFIDLQRKCGSFPKAYWRQNGNETKNVTVWCSNDYLGMGQHPKVLNAMKQAITDFGAGAGGTRNIAGTHHAIVKLENELASLHSKDKALVFSSGYVANESTLSTLGKLIPNCIIFSDSQNHSSMINGIKNSGCTKIIFNHNDMKDLRQKLHDTPIECPKIIAFESVYSMDGDIGNIAEIVSLAKQYNCYTYLDEVHAVGLYGKKGAGVAESLGIENEIDIIQGTLAKAFGLQGGYIAGNDILIDCIRSFAPGFIFTTTMSPILASGAVASIHHCRNNDKERIAMHKVSNYVKRRLLELNFPVLNCESHIVPIIVGDAIKCKQACDLLLNKYSIYIQPINFPTVSRGSERLRITPSPVHDKKSIEELIIALEATWQYLGLPRQIYRPVTRRVNRLIS